MTWYGLRNYKQRGSSTSSNWDRQENESGSPHTRQVDVAVWRAE